ncbi:hypothetical protein Tco_1509488 [Tanacetum coccineum]
MGLSMFLSFIRLIRESVGTLAGRVILFDTTLTTIPNTTPIISPPTTHTDTIVTPTKIPTVLSTLLPTSDPSEDPSSDHIPPLPAISPFFSSADDTSDNSSSEASSDFHSDPSFDSSSRHSLPDYSSLDLPSTSAGQSRKRRRSPMTSVPALLPTSGALSPVCVNLIPSPKRVRDSDYLADVEVDSRESSEPSRSRGTNVGVDDDIKRVDESHSKPEIEPATQEAVQEERAAEGTYETLGSMVQRFHHNTVAIPVHRVQVIEGVQREHGRRIIRVESAVNALTKRIVELKRDNKRLRGIASVEGQRVDRL